MSWATYYFSRTVGDSIDEAIQVIVRQLDGSEVAIPDSTTATMHLLADPVINISSVHMNLEDGIRYFDGDALAAIPAGQYQYEIELNYYGESWTPIKGEAEFFEEIS